MATLGMIEVRGYLGAVSVADTALKAANVTLSNAEVIRGGITTVELTGDVAAVNAAIAAAVQTAESLNCLLSSHVIARLDEQTKVLIKKTEQFVSQPIVEKVPKTEASDVIEDEETVSEVKTSESSKENLSDDLKAKLIDKKVVELRTIAYKMNLKTLSKKEIKFATKDTLIDVIMAEAEGNEIDWD